MAEEILNSDMQSNLIELSKQEFHDMLKNGSFSDLCDNNCLHYDWTPFLINTEQHVSLPLKRDLKVSKLNLDIFFYQISIFTVILNKNKNYYEQAETGGDGNAAYRL